MPNLAIGIGFLLVLLGAGGYLFSPSGSVTALIPAFLGALIALCGLVGRRGNLRRHAMHAAAALGLLGFLGTLGGVGGLFTLLAGGTVARPVAVVVQAVTALLCLVFVAFAVRSFIEARRGRKVAT